MNEQSPYRTADIDFSHAVRSIRMAAALNERYAALLQTQSYGNDEALSNAIGELRQLVPEIWSLLDDARRELADRGHDLSAYDAVRATPAARSPAVLDVTEVRASLAPFMVRGKSRTATFNAAGQRAAAEANDLLRAALPRVDWDALEQADAVALADINLGPPLWKKVVFYTFALLLSVIAIAGYLYYRLGSPHT